MAARLRDRTQGLPVDVHQLRFEDFEADGPFDAVVSATAFHWVPAEIGYPKAASHLRPAGWLAVWWTIFDDPNDPDDVYPAIAAILDRHITDGASKLAGPPDYCLDRDARTADFTRTGAFETVEFHRFDWEYSHQPRQLRDLVATYGPVLALPETKRAALLDDVEHWCAGTPTGQATRNYRTALYLSQRRG